MATVERVQIGEHVLYRGDCLDVLPTIAHGSIDAVVTDPPYGIAGSSGTIGKLRSHKTSYSGKFSDTLDTIETTVVPAITLALSMTKCGIVTPGNRAVFRYPSPAEIGMIHQPATVSLGPWGRMQAQPLLFYGRDPFCGLRIQDTVYRMTEPPSSDLHPCAKPIGFCRWAVNRASKPGETILDPFMGSGTTGVACVQTGRKFVGVEIDPKYFDIACRRIETAMGVGTMFDATKPAMASLFEEPT